MKVTGRKLAGTVEGETLAVLGRHPTGSVAHVVVRGLVAGLLRKPPRGKRVLTALRRLRRGGYVTGGNRQPWQITKCGWERLVGRVG